MFLIPKSRGNWDPMANKKKKKKKEREKEPENERRGWICGMFGGT
jgi:hypothetical protein